jgi:hypothetical protein
VGRKSRVSGLIKMAFRTIAIVSLWYGPRERPRFPILCSIFEEHSKLILGARVLAPIIHNRFRSFSESKVVFGPSICAAPLTR